MKKYLFLAAAALGLAACAEKGLDNGPVNNGELEQSYVAITLAADDMATKAVTNGNDYDPGLDVERQVGSAYAFFFKDGETEQTKGQPFLVNLEGNTSTNSGEKNYLEINPTNADKQDGMDNVSDIKNSVLVLQNYKGEYPDQIVVVLNWTPKKNKYTLAELRDVIDGIKTTDGFIMSNAVYANSKNQTIDAVALTADNIFANEKDALDHPVIIHVERVAAKVTFAVAPNTANGDVIDGTAKRFDIGKDVNGKIYAEVKGYELYNANEQSYLIKRIKPLEWSDVTLGFGWNDVAWFRSYWADSYVPTEGYPNNNFRWNNPTTSPDYSYETPVYCGENTTTNNPKLIVKAQLQRDNGEAVEVTNWYGKEYVGEGALKVVVANTLKNKYFYSTDNKNFIGLSDADLKCVLRGGEENAYEVYFQLSTEGTTPGISKTWYKYENGDYTELAPDNFNEELAEVQPALVYKSGMTYYYIDIKHLGDEDTDGEFGIVRNHVYRVNITDINGFGTPVYDGTHDFIVPDKPDPVTSYVAAQINILSWRVVENNYELK